MRKLVHIALTALFLLGIASAQSVPVDLSAGYSYLNFNQPSSNQTPSYQLKMSIGWDFAAAIGRFHHVGVEADFSGHSLSDCGSVTSVTCNNLSYMFGPRYTSGDRSSRFTFFVHGLIGKDNATLLGLAPTSSTPTVSNTSFAMAGGGGLDIWFLRHVGLQLGPVDYFYTNHLSNNGATAQSSLRAVGGIAFRFGGDFGPTEPKAPKEPEEKPESHRSWKRPWHKTVSAPSESQPPAATSAPPRTAQPAQPAQPAQSAQTAQTSQSLNVPLHGMAIHAFGLVVGPQEFDGARVLQLEPGGVAEMASLHVGDLIKSVDGKPVRTPMELAAELSDKTGKIRIGLQRGELSVETLILLGTH